MRSRVAVASAACAVVMGGCGGPGASDAPLSQARDSAGITIVDNQAPPRGARLSWQISEAPVLSIGTLEGEDAYQLFRVTDATRLQDGRIAVVNGGSQELRIFDAAGVHVASWGREGEGPGEFTGLSRVERWTGDSVLASDFRQDRISVFDAGGTLGRTFLLDAPEEISSPGFDGVLRDGTLVVGGGVVFSAGESEPGMDRRDQSFARLSAEGEPIGSLGTHRGTEFFVQASEGFVSVTGHPFARSSVTAPWGDLYLISPNDDYELRAYTAEGALARIVRREHTARYPTHADLDAAIERQLEGVDESERDQLRRMYDGIPLVESFPAFGSVRVDALGYLWVAEYAMPGEERSDWTVFDSGGHVQGRIETPADLRIYEIGEDYLLGRIQDELDVEYVQVYSLARGGSR
jgi:hypothetical protein